MCSLPSYLLLTFAFLHGLKMSFYIVIRESKLNDKALSDQVLQNGISSNISNAFWAAVTKELTLQLVILTAAVLFIFIGVPLILCIIAVPIVAVIIYSIVAAAYHMKIAEYKQGPRSRYSWVAEVYEPFFFAQSPKEVSYTILTELDANKQNIDAGRFQRQVIGTVSVDKHRGRHYSAWLHKLAVDSRYRRKGVGSALIVAAIQKSEKERFETIECATSESQLPARHLLLSSGFQLIQMYHKKLTIGILEKYLMAIKFGPSMEAEI